MSWAVGDVVQLKSGGPSMTVSDVNTGALGDKVACEWFDGSKRMRENFSPDALKKPDGPLMPSKG